MMRTPLFRRNFLLIPAAAAVVSGLASSPLHAAERYFVENSGTSPFICLCSWASSPGGVGGASVPAAADTANFTLTGTYAVNFSGISPTNTSLDVEAGTVTFELFGGTYTLSSVVRIGLTVGSTSRLTLFDGTLDVDTNGDNIEVGTFDVDGFLTVSTNATIGAFGSNPDILLGNGGDGTLTINNGGVVNSTSGSFGLISALATGTATVTGLGSQWVNSGAFIVGSSGTGTLTVQSGATISGTGSQIGSGGGSIGNATVTGAGSSWSESASLSIGNAGTGSLTISSGGAMTVGTTASIGSNSRSFGTVSVSGTGSRWTIGASLLAGSFGQGTLTVSSGGQVMCAGLIVGVGISATTDGTVTITGTGSSLTASGAADIGDQDNGSLTVSNGGVLITKAGLDIGAGTTGVGDVTVTGANALWTNTGTINVANLGAGTLTVSNGGAINTSGTLNINDPAGTPFGTLNFDGGTITAASVVRAAGGIFNWTDGTVRIVDGAFNNAGANLTINGADATDLPALHLADTAGGSGFTPTTLTVGANHQGALAITGGSALTVTNLLIGSTDGGSGTVTVGGNASSLTVDGTGSGFGVIAVGGTVTAGGGAGVLNIDAGATVISDSLQIWAGGTVNLNGGTLQTLPFGSTAGQFHFNSGTYHFNGSAAGNFTPFYDALLGFEHRLTAGKAIIYDANFFFSGMSLIIDGGAFTVGTGLTVSPNSILEVRSGSLASGTLTNDAASQVVLTGGNTTLTTTFTNAGDLRLAATTDFALITGTTLTNTGLIHGNGQIGMGMTNNSAGLVRVAADERMVFTGGSINNGTGRFEVSAGGDLQFTNTLANNAAIDVIGGTLRVDGPATNATSIGRITGRDAVMRFNGGLINNGSLAFSFGTSDIFGDIVNNAVNGRVVVSGNSSATFYDDLMNNGAVQVSAGSTAVYFGAVSGPGSFPGGGTNFFEGDLSPGSSPALVSYGGNVVFGTFNTLTMEIGGTARGNQHDALNVAGSLTFDGTLKVELISSFQPQLGNSFNLFDWGTAAGAFTAVTVVDHGLMPPGLGFDFSELYTTGVIRVISTTGMTFAQWAATVLGEPGAAPGGDHDSDGYDNATEFALGLFPPQPGTMEPNGGFFTYIEGQRLRLLFTRPLDRTGVTLKVQASNDLTNWSDLAVSVNSAVFTGAGFVSENRAHPLSEAGLVEVRDIVNAGGEARRYLRIQVTLVP